MSSNPLQTFLAEPAIADPPARVWRDWVIAAAIVIGSILEAVFRTDVPWKIPTLVVSVLVAASVMWRRTHRLSMMLLAFGAIDAISIAIRITDDGVFGYYSMAFLLVIPYALFRWGSGREAAWGVVIMLVGWIVGITTDPGPVSEAVGGLIVLTIPPVIGIQVRQFHSSRRQAVDQARLAERELLARELHDTVAHHVSAIAIQAQAGRAVADTNPGAALAALAVIEDAASRTLAEMRTMVSALRHDGEQAAMAPQRGVADIERLRGLSADGPPIDVQLTGDLRDLPPSLDAALYRIAEESITNASRHAVGATRIDVRVVGEPDEVRLTITDDGRGAPGLGESGDGFGLVGMTERAKLLGGSVTAGRDGARGWVVDAALPRDRATP